MSALFILLSICFATFSGVSCIQLNSVNQIRAVSELTAEEKIFKFVTSGVADIFWFNVFDRLRHNDSHVSFECQKSFVNIFNGIDNGHIWAFKFVDATAKSPSGFLDGSTSSLGDFDECLQIEVLNSDHQFNGQYCVVHLVADEGITDGVKNNFGHRSVRVNDGNSAVRRMISQYNSCPENVPIRAGLCIPSTCTKEDIRNLVSTALHHYSWNVHTIANCDTSKSIALNVNNMTNIQILSFVLVFSFILLVSFATIVDLLSLNALMHTKIVRNFSALKNTAKLFDRFEPNRMVIVDTCRLTLILIELGLHSNTFSGLLKGLGLMTRKEDAALYTDQLWFQPYNLIYGESIFAVGGMTAALSLIPMLERKNVVKAAFSSVVKRWFRFTAITLFAIALQMIWQFTHSGPVFNEFMKQQVDVCSRYWWSHILFVNNLIHPQNYCMPHTWSVGAEFQLYLLAVVTIILLSKSRILGLVFAGIVMILGMIIPAVYTYIHDFKPIGVYPMDFREMESQFYYLYLSTSPHTTSYFIFLMAYYYKVYHFKADFQKSTFWIITVVTALCMLIATYAPLPWNMISYDLGVTAAIVHVFFVRLLFVLFPAWIYFLKLKSPFEKKAAVDANANVSANGANNQVNNNGSNRKPRQKMFRVARALTRLVGSMYYAHSFFIYWDGLSTRTAVSWSPFLIAKTVILGLYFGILSGYLFHILVEAPLNNTFFGKPSVDKLKKS